MKTEKFEDQIRKKLESIEPEFHEKDWLKFNEYSSAKLATSAKIFSSTIFKIAASVAVVGTMFISFAQYKSNSDLKEKVQSLATQNENLLKNQKVLEKILSNEKKSALNELNGIAKINQSEENLSYATPKSTDNLEREFETKTNSDNLSEIRNNTALGNNSAKNNILKATNKSNNNDVASYNFSNKSKIFTDEKPFLANQSAKKRNLSGNNESSDNLYFVGKEKSNKEETKILKNGELIGNNSIEFDKNINLDYKESNANNLNFNYLKGINIRIDSTKKLRKAFNKNDFAYYKINTEKKKLYLTLADAYLRTGLNSSVSRGTFIYGIGAELFLDQRFSLSTGISNMDHTGQAFITTTHYKKVMNKDFKESFKDKIPAQREIMNIKENTQVSVIPVHLNYNHPIGNGMKLISTIGTELDIKGSSKFSFNVKRGPLLSSPFQQQPAPSNEEFESESFNTALNTKLFNNVYLALGAEKQFGKFAVQGKIYDNFLIKDINYRKPNRLGAELGLYYRL